jgi:cell division septum initiation protein DivIVA
LSRTPESISEPNLPRAKVGGYSIEATDEFLKEIAWDWRRINSDCRKLAERNAELEQQLDEIHRRIEALRDDASVAEQHEPRSAAALAAAYRAAEAIREDARQESETLLKKARKRAAVLDDEVERAREQSAERIRDFEEVQQHVRRRLSSFLAEMLEAVETSNSTATPEDIVRELTERTTLTADVAPAQVDD